MKKLLEKKTLNSHLKLCNMFSSDVDISKKKIRIKLNEV
jgi:hypothetical protein